MLIAMRVFEHRVQGYTERGALVRSLYKTGGLVSSCGITMAVSFSGLFLGSIMGLYQLAFMLIVAVLLDTFVVRTLVVPSVTSLLGGWNWAPRKLPPGTLNELGEVVATAPAAAGATAGAGESVSSSGAGAALGDYTALP